MGIGAQLLLWPDDFCRAPWPRGFVIRYDNRDVGLSGKTQAQRTQPLWLLMLRAQLGWQNAGALYPGGHGGGRDASARSPAYPTGPRLGRLDGRHDRAGAGRRLSAACRLVVHLVLQHQSATVAAAGTFAAVAVGAPTCRRSDAAAAPRGDESLPARARHSGFTRRRRRSWMRWCIGC